MAAGRAPTCSTHLIDRLLTKNFSTLDHPAHAHILIGVCLAHGDPRPDPSPGIRTYPSFEVGLELLLRGLCFGPIEEQLEAHELQAGEVSLHVDDLKKLIFDQASSDEGVVTVSGQGKGGVGSHCGDESGDDTLLLANEGSQDVFSDFGRGADGAVGA